MGVGQSEGGAEWGGQRGRGREGVGQRVKASRMGDWNGDRRWDMRGKGEELGDG